MRWLGLAPLFYLLCACDVASVREAPSTIARNECERDTDCGAGGVCVLKQCRSRDGTATLENVLFEVTPPADGSAIAGVQFLLPKDLAAGDDASLNLGGISQVAGEVTADKLGCVTKFLGAGVRLAIPPDFSLPAQVSLSPTSGALGLYSPRAVVQSELRGSSYFGFSVNVPPGSYDIYVAPNQQEDETCPVPPQLIRGKAIESSTLQIGLPKPSVFEFHVSWPRPEGALNGWMVDMLDPTSGLVISNRVPLALGKGGTTETANYVASLSYNPVLVVGDEKAQQDQLIRLSPPADSAENEVAPTLLLARSALGLFASGRGTLTGFTSLPKTVHVHGQVTALDTPTPVAATVSLVAKKITGIEPGVLATLMRTVSVGADGQFDVYLLPGTYQVSTLPLTPLDPSGENKTPLAADTREWSVPSAPTEQAGKVIVLNNALPVTGRVSDASGAPVATAQVQAVASPWSIQSNILQQSMGEGAFVPRASAGGVNSDGDFAFKTDPGTFDITVRPNADTGFAWLVMPNVLIPSVGINLILSMPLPFPYHGTVTMAGADGATVVPGALIRAYIYLKGGEYSSDATKADSVLQVAETRADKYGAFDILIPAELNHHPE